MQELLTAVTYIVMWLICDKVLGIQSGLYKLIISLGSAVAVYVICAVEERRIRKKKGEREDDT
jgi:hypothetical protein